MNFNIRDWLDSQVAFLKIFSPFLLWGWGRGVVWCGMWVRGGTKSDNALLLLKLFPLEIKSAESKFDLCASLTQNKNYGKRCNCFA